MASPLGASGATCPPPTSDRTPREIDADQRRFWYPKKMGVGLQDLFVYRFTGFAPTFYMHQRYGGRSLVLRLRKKRELWKLLKELLW